MAEATAGGQRELARAAWLPLIKEALWRRQGRPDVRRGVRGALVVGVPLVAIVATGDKQAAELVALGALQAVLVDDGSSYRSKATALATAALACGAAMAFGTLAGSTAWLAVVLTGVWCGVWSFSGAFGARYQSVGLVASVVLLFGLVQPGDLATAGLHAGLIVAGFAWTALWVLGPWPWRRDRPALEALGATLSQAAVVLGRLAEDARGAAASGRAGLRRGDGAWSEAVTEERRCLEEAEEVARSTYGSGWSDLPLVRLSLTCERLTVRVSALRQAIDLLAGGGEAGRPLLEAVGSVAQAAADEVAGSAAAVGGTGGSPGTAGPLAPALAQAEHAYDELHLALGPTHRPVVSDAGLVLSALDRLADSVAMVTRVASEEPPHGAEQFPAASPFHAVKKALRPHLSWESPRARLGARLGVMTAAAQAVVVGWQLDHGLWLILTLLTIMRTEQSVTEVRTIQRLAGTLVGSAVAAAILSAVAGPISLAVIIAVLLGACVSLLRVNYSYFVVLVTPVALMLVSLVAPGGWRVAAIRTGLTAAGAALSVLGNSLLWPSREGDTVPCRIAAVITATAGYLSETLRQAEAAPADRRPLTPERRSAEDAYAVARDELDRLALGSPGRQRAAARWAPALQAAAELLGTVRTTAVALVDAGSTERPASGGASSLSHNPLSAPETHRLVGTLEDYRDQAVGCLHALAEATSAVDGAEEPPGPVVVGPITADEASPLQPELLEGPLNEVFAARQAELATGVGLDEVTALRQAAQRWHALSRLARRLSDETGRLLLAVRNAGAQI
jgi:uncharacterized membrane protein YccC